MILLFEKRFEVEQAGKVRRMRTRLSELRLTKNIYIYLNVLSDTRSMFRDHYVKSIFLSPFQRKRTILKYNKVMYIAMESYLAGKYAVLFCLASSLGILRHHILYSLL